MTTTPEYADPAMPPDTTDKPIRKNVFLPDELWYRLRVAAVTRQQTLYVLLTEIVLEWLDRNDAANQRQG